jgi:hypothetical protein
MRPLCAYVLRERHFGLLQASYVMVNTWPANISEGHLASMFTVGGISILIGLVLILCY